MTSALWGAAEKRRGVDTEAPYLLLMMSLYSECLRRVTKTGQDGEGMALNQHWSSIQINPN